MRMLRFSLATLKKVDTLIYTDAQGTVSMQANGERVNVSMEGSADNKRYVGWDGFLMIRSMMEAITGKKFLRQGKWGRNPKIFVREDKHDATKLAATGSES